MTKFKFHLQSVLDYRQEVEKEKRQCLLTEEEKLKKLHEELLSLEGELSKLRETIDTQTFTVFGYQQAIRYKDSLLIKRENVLAKLHDQQQCVHRAETVWHESKQEVRMLEKLKEKKVLLFKEELERKENQELDDLTTMRF